MNSDIQVNIPEKDSNYTIYIDDAPVEELKSKILGITGNTNYLVVINNRVNKLYAKKLGFDKKKILVILIPLLIKNHIIGQLNCHHSYYYFS